LEDLDVVGIIILKRIFKKHNIRMYTGLIWLRSGPVAGFL